MAIEKTVESRSIVIQNDNGTSDSGKQMVKSATYSNVKDDATNENMYNVGKAIGQLKDSSLIAVKVSERFALENDED